MLAFYRAHSFIPLVLAMFFLLTAQAQTEKGYMTTGSNVQVSYFSQDTIHSFDININPNLGYFVINNLMLGASIGVGLTSDNRGPKGKSRLVLNTSFTPAIRYYFLKEKLRPFLFLRFGYTGATTIVDGRTQNIDGFLANGGLGLNYFFNEQIALEATLGYTGTKQTARTLQSRMALGLGVQIFFRATVKE